MEIFIPGASGTWMWEVFMNNSFPSVHSPEDVCPGFSGRATVHKERFGARNHSGAEALFLFIVLLFRHTDPADRESPGTFLPVRHTHPRSLSIRRLL